MAGSEAISMDVHGEEVVRRWAKICDRSAMHIGASSGSKVGSRQAASTR